MNVIKRIFGCVSVACLSTTILASVSFISSNAATTIYGDVNNDGTVNIGDVVIANKFLSGKMSTSSINMKYLDVDKNAVIDVNDSKTIMQSIIHNIPSLPYSESGSTFNFYNYSLPADSSRNYVKYNCQTGNKSTYTLSQASTVTTYSGDTDDREIDSSNNAQAIVYLSYKKSDGKYYRGSGFIVSDHIIATCAHCLYDGQNFNTDYEVEVYNTNGTSVIATYSPKELHIPSQYYNSSSGNYDYGLIYVEENLSAYGNIALGVATNNFKLTSQTINVSGFPSKVNGTNTNYRYYGVGNVTSETTDYELFYTTYASGGDSGGPVYIEYTLNGETFRSAIGIHTHGYEDGSTHSGTRITLPLLRFYNDNINIG